MGNTISKKELNRKTAEEELRKAAKARRAAKLVDKIVSEEKPDTGEESVDRPKWLQDYDKVKAKLANGKKLSGKDKKLLKRGQAREAEDAELGITYGEDEEETPLDKRLEGFSLSIPGGQTDSNDDQARDVVIKGISISAPEKPLIVNADLTLSRGRRYGLIGANGRGKSTLLRFLAARRLPVPSTMDILLVEQEVAASKRTVLEDVLAADKQRSTLLKEEKHLFDVIEKSNDGDDMTSTAKRLTVVANELDVIGADGAEARARAILSGLGFTEAMVDNSSSKLSGGWRMRVSLARALFAAPKLLLLDEPTNHLDLDAVLWLDTYLTEQFPKTSTVLTVSHDRDFLDEVCTDLILLTDDGGLENHRGGLRRLDEGVASRNAKRAKDYALQQKMLKQEKVKHPSLKIEKLTSSLLTSLNISRLAEKPREYKVHFDFVAPDDARTGAGLSVDLRDICFSYDRAFRGFKDLNLCVDATKRGSPLSELTILPPTSGEVNVGRNLKIGYYDQHFSELKKCPRNSSAVDYLLGESLLTSAQEARKWLGKFGLDSARHVIPVKDLSGGQKARVCFASIALRKPHLLILDEPTNHLDLESADALVDGINAYGGGVLAVSHDATVAKCPTSLWVVPRGLFL
ncbi:P-loop containing nucleoside triphosphate hydrolase protein [Fragilariopsis cylindrus CCMP1102]|uniref:p-loop containing nucleoside triphosphate hydrolase protein n=1 Tax=Fragilariopsis cylindrus CCMP1102 TaxID=635003 RepID=A0A1E7F4Z1_9STRA|nr:P-loop containing nucleoside triphosphate hydrolase protein [Fragilariopsis cylindrus CCMP1102]|eukprot:OEU13209.1 P-loop containing nucleoside triphosphate hydrolase protein [Fragilariopsis cylindrus CCMP1102]